MRTLAIKLFLSLFLCLVVGFQPGGIQNSNKPWYETLPAVAMDYKVHIDPGKEDCYFQYVNAGATFYVSFQVSINIYYLYYIKFS